MLPLLATAQLEYSVELTDIKVNLNGSEYELEDQVAGNLVVGQIRTVPLFQQDGISYFLDLKVARSGKRLKLIRQGRLTSPAKAMQGKSYKAVKFVGTSSPGPLAGRHSENFLYDKASLGSAFISFKYMFHYK